MLFILLIIAIILGSLYMAVLSPHDDDLDDQEMNDFKTFHDEYMKTHSKKKGKE